MIKLIRNNYPRKIVFGILLLIFICAIIYYMFNNTKNKDNKENFPYIVSSFSGHNGSNLDLYTTSNMKDFKQLNSSPLFKPLPGYLRDPSIIFYHHSFYICYTGYLKGEIGFTIAKSNDLKKWEQHFIKMPGGITDAWAPQWVIDKNAIYILISLSDGTNERDINKNDIGYFKSYLFKAKDKTLTNFTWPIPLNYSKQSNHIDPCIIRKNNKYYLFVKNEHDKVIEEFVSDQIAGNYRYIQTLQFDHPVEGPSIVKKNNTYYLYADEFTIGKSTLLTSTDLKTWSKSENVGAAGSVRTQHFDVFQLNKESLSKIEVLSK